MIENIANGIITGFGILSGAASMGSYISGFSLEKDVDKIKKSLNILEDIKNDIRNYPREETILLKNLNKNIDVFYSNNKEQQINIFNEISRLFEQQENLINKQQKMVLESLNEMKKIILSIKFNIGTPKNVSSDFTRNIIKNPYEMGVHEFSPFSYDLFQNNDNIISKNISPVIWTDFAGHKYFGKMNKSIMNKYGFDVNTNMFTVKKDGYRYSSKYGIYLPDVLLMT